MSITPITINPVGAKENKAFMILSALGILFVVDEHLGRPISFLAQIFPYDSFYMPLFVFVSGYFFNEEHAISFKNAFRFTWKKCRNVLFPYFFWILFYFVFTAVLRRFGIIRFGDFSLKNLIVDIVTMGTSFGYNDPSWFVPMLFCVSVSYCFLRTIFRKCWNDPFAAVLLILIGAAAVYGSGTAFNTAKHYMLLKTAFFMQFYQLGIVFRNYFEKNFDKVNETALCLICIIINIFLLAQYGSNIRFPNCARMGGFRTDNLFLPLITSVTAIAFWLKISKTLVPVIGNNRMVNFLSDHTSFVMTHHLTAKAFFTGLLITGNKFGITNFSSLDVSQFQNSAWYNFNEIQWVNLLCFVFTVAFTLVACKLLLLAKGVCRRLPFRQFPEANIR